MFEMGCPGEPLTTWIEAVPAVATSVARILAVSLVAETNVVTRDEPFHCTIAPLAKFAPLTISVKGALPGAILTGPSADTCGTGCKVPAKLHCAIINNHKTRDHFIKFSWTRPQRLLSTIVILSKGRAAERSSVLQIVILWQVRRIRPQSTHR